MIRDLAVQFDVEAIKGAMTQCDENGNCKMLDYKEVLQNPEFWEEFDLSFLREMVPNYEEIVEEIKDNAPAAPAPKAGTAAPTAAPSSTPSKASDSSNAMTMFTASG